MYVAPINVPSMVISGAERRRVRLAIIAAPQGALILAVVVAVFVDVRGAIFAIAAILGWTQLAGL